MSIEQGKQNFAFDISSIPRIQSIFHSRSRDSFGKSVLFIAPSGLRFTRMEHIESTSRKETRFPSKYATNLGSIHPRLLLPSTIRFSQRLSPKTFRQPLFMKSIIQVWNRSYFREKNSTTIFLFSMIYKCLLGQGIENTVNTVDALYIYIYYVLIKYRYRFIVYTCRFKFRRISL